jgi:protein-S-isoprenylcysteine O-methyltransferase Ste14
MTMAGEGYLRDEKKDFIHRGVKRASPVGTSVLVGLRLLDPLLQHAILTRGLGSGLIHRLGGRTVPHGAPVSGLESLNISPYRLVLLLMAVGSAVKQSYWAIWTSEEEIPVGNAVSIGVFNTVFNSLNSLLFTWRMTSAARSEAFSDSGFPSAALVLGTGLYITGILVETISEVQRKQFKSDPRNKGKLYSGGLFSLARHINYGGYSLWRGGFALAGGGWIWGAIVGGFFITDFSRRSIPALDAYCQDRVSCFLHSYLNSWTNVVCSMVHLGRSSKRRYHTSFCQVCISMLEAS